MLEMKGIEIQFPGVKALDKVDFSMNSGEIHALLGENGAGKSTLIKCLTGVHHMDAGTILFDGKEIREAWKARTVKAAVNTIRIMTANHVRDRENKKRLLKMVRKNLWYCMKSRYLTPSAKLSVFVCSFSPRLEQMMWIIYN